VPSSIETSGASGGECDRVDLAHAPPNLQILARGQNTIFEPYNEGAHAEMTYYDHPAGGFVFSAGSLSFCGSRIGDSAIRPPRERPIAWLSSPLCRLLHSDVP